MLLRGRKPSALTPKVLAGTGVIDTGGGGYPGMRIRGDEDSADGGAGGDGTARIVTPMFGIAAAGGMKT